MTAAAILSPDALARVQCRLRRLGFGLAPLPFGGVLVEKRLADTGAAHVIGRAESLEQLQGFFPLLADSPEFWS